LSSTYKNSEGRTIKICESAYSRSVPPGADVQSDLLGSEPGKISL